DGLARYAVRAHVAGKLLGAACRNRRRRDASDPRPPPTVEPYPPCSRSRVMSVVEATPDFEQTDRSDRAFLGHPKGLGFLGFTEACERFSYYSMQTLLTLYMVNYLLLPGHIEQISGFG